MRGAESLYINIKMKIELILTNDWELFGDGSGDYFEIQRRPLDMIHELIRNYGIKITLFAEVEQQFAFKKYSDKSQYLKDASSDWEAAVQETVKLGSDAQLHSHPQWRGAEWKADGWRLDMKKWRLGDLSENEIFAILNSGRQYLNDIIKPISPEYECLAFRAGSYCIQPYGKTIPELKKAGFKCDSSIVPGVRNADLYDFSNHNEDSFKSEKAKLAPHKGYGLLELPIWTFSKIESEALKKFAPRLNYLIFYSKIVSNGSANWMKRRDSVKSKRYPRSKRFYKQAEKKNLFWAAKKIICSNRLTLDYDYTPAEVFVKIIQEISREFESFDGIIPVVASGHVKDMPNADNLKRIIELLDKQMGETATYSTVSQTLRRIDSNKPELKKLYNNSKIACSLPIYL